MVLAPAWQVSLKSVLWMVPAHLATGILNINTNVPGKNLAHRLKQYSRWGIWKFTGLRAGLECAMVRPGNRVTLAEQQWQLAHRTARKPWVFQHLLFVKNQQYVWHAARLNWATGLAAWSLQPKKETCSFSISGKREGGLQLMITWNSHQKVLGRKHCGWVGNYIEALHVAWTEEQNQGKT